MEPKKLEYPKKCQSSKETNFGPNTNPKIFHSVAAEGKLNPL